MSLADAVKRATAGLTPAPKAPEPRLDPFEVAAEEFASAKTPGDRAEALRAIAELVRLQK